MVKPGTVVCVTWIDAIIRHEASRSGDLKPILVKTYGIVVKDDPEFLAVAHEEFPGTEDLRGVTTIPRGMIRKIKRLK